MSSTPPSPPPPAEAPTQAPFADLPDGAVRLVQITDTHLYADPGGALLGMVTLDSLDAVVDLVAGEALPADAVLATGDLVHDGSAAGYALLRERLARLGCPVLALPGNHDDPTTLAAVLAQPPVTNAREARFADWHVLLLDSTVPGEDGGLLGEGELAWLDERLSSGPGHSLVCLHHSPLPTGSDWLDTMRLANAEAFFAVLDRHPTVRGVLFGHIHQTLEATRNGVRIMGSPSTCVQFAKVRPRFGLDPRPPGYRWLALLPDGGIRSGVRRLSAAVGTVDLDAGGY